MHWTCVLDRRNQSHKQITAYQFSRLEDPKFGLDAVEDVKVLLASGYLRMAGAFTKFKFDDFTTKYIDLANKKVDYENVECNQQAWGEIWGDCPRNKANSHIKSHFRWYPMFQRLNGLRMKITQLLWLMDVQPSCYNMKPDPARIAVKRKNRRESRR